MVQKRQKVTSLYDNGGEGVVTVNTDGSVDNKDYATVKDNLDLQNDYLPRLAQVSITNDETNTYTVTGTGLDTLIPPTGYVQLSGFTQEIQVGNITYSAGEITLPVDGVYQADGWVGIRHSANSATSALVFGVTPSGGSVTLTTRPTADISPNNSKLHNIAGGGSFYATAGSTLSIWVASDTSGDITIPNATLRVWYVAPAID